MTRDRETARRIAQEVQPLGGSVYYVGGCVRDRLLGRESKDLDIEVHGVTPQQLEIVLDRMGSRRTVGPALRLRTGRLRTGHRHAPAGGRRGPGGTGTSPWRWTRGWGRREPPAAGISPSTP